MYKVSKIVSTILNGLLPPLLTSILPYCKSTQINLISNPPQNPISDPKNLTLYIQKKPCSNPRKASISDPPNKPYIKPPSKPISTLNKPCRLSDYPKKKKYNPQKTLFWTLINPKTETIFVKRILV
jgi:hypothetical protein